MLLTRLDQVLSREIAESDTLEYVDRVLDEWSNFAVGRKLRHPDRKERTFWYALYQLEEIAEFPTPGQFDPFQEMLMKNLACVTQALRERGELPMQFFATRPGEEPEEDWIS